MGRCGRDRLRAAAAGAPGESCDVGNPWLDAGIVGLSTLKWNTDREYWAQWYPADWISESFPGQFRNWFYALLTESTVMTGEAPARALFGYATLLDEDGEEMHKSKGNSIPFDEAAERIGSDVMRWMYAAANPAVNLRFGYGPGHEVVRRFFLPLWNTYGFFVTYARLDGWTPDQADGVADARTLLDRWILSRLDALVAEARDVVRRLRRDARHAGHRGVRRRPLELVRAPQPASVLEGRARRRQARRLRDAVRGAHDADAQLLAPIIPHVADAIWDNLVTSVDADAPDSVHLTDFPEQVAGRADPAVDRGVELARRTVALGRGARSARGAAHPAAAADRPRQAAGRGHRLRRRAERRRELRQEIREELNVREIELIPDESEMVERTLYPLLPVIGPRHGNGGRGDHGRRPLR